jgi:hypothetical protein
MCDTSPEGLTLPLGRTRPGVDMALRVVTMTELRLEVLLEPQRTGESVAEVCRRREISRQSYYRFKRRYEAEGPEGLEARSRRPLCSPGQIDVDLEVEICRMRKDHKRWGGPSDPGRAPQGRTRPAGRLHHPPGPPEKPPGGRPAPQPSQGPQALRAGGPQRPVADRCHQDPSPRRWVPSASITQISPPRP